MPYSSERSSWMCFTSYQFQIGYLINIIQREDKDCWARKISYHKEKGGRDRRKSKHKENGKEMSDSGRTEK